MFFFVWFGLSVFCCLFSSVEDIRFFAFHLFSYNLRTVDRPQDVLMTVRASSVHGMSYKKILSDPITERSGHAASNLGTVANHSYMS